MNIRVKTSGSNVNCGCVLAVLIFNLALGGWSVNYLLDFLASKNIPFFWDMVIGLFVGQFSVPLAVIVKILAYFNVL